MSEVKLKDNLRIHEDARKLAPVMRDVSSRMNMNKSKRKAIPKSTQAKVLIQSRRRCCLCYFWDGDATQKDGQIAHIDHDPRNVDFDNLAYLCFRHHNEFDTMQSQGKSVGSDEMRHARGLLYHNMAGTGDPLVSVIIHIDSEYDEFTPLEEQRLLRVVKALLNTGDGDGDVVD